MSIAQTQTGGPGHSATGPKHHIYPNTSPPNRKNYPPTPDITPEPSLKQHAVAILDAGAPPPLTLPLSLALPRSQESHHGSPTVSPSPSSQPSTSTTSSEAIESSSQRNTTSDVSGGFGNYLEKSVTFRGGEPLPFAIVEEDEPSDAPSSSSFYSTNSEGRPGMQRRERTRSSLSVVSKDRGRPTISKRSYKGRSLKKRIKHMFGVPKGGFKGGDRVQL